MKTLVCCDGADRHIKDVVVIVDPVVSLYNMTSGQMS